MVTDVTLALSVTPGAPATGLTRVGVDVEAPGRSAELWRPAGRCRRLHLGPWARHRARHACGAPSPHPLSTPLLTHKSVARTASSAAEQLHYIRSKKGFGLLRPLQKWVYWWASNYASPGLTVLGRRSPGLPAPAQAGTRGAISVNSCGVLCKRGTTRARSPCRSLSSDSLLARARRDTPRISRASARAHSYTQWSVHAVPDSIFVLRGSRRPE